jgi:hypothetical protein
MDTVRDFFRLLTLTYYREQKWLARWTRWGGAATQSSSRALCQTRVTKKKGVTRRYAMER